MDKEVQYINPDLFTPKDAWGRLSMEEKAAMMEVAVKNGITNLKDIRDKYNEFAEGGDLSDKEYIAKMEKVAEENYKDWGFASPEEALTHILNDNTYDYRGYYDENPQSEANAETHWPDIYKTVYHPTFSGESRYSGQVSQFNLQGLPGGFWSGDTFVPQAWQLHTNNQFGGGGSKSDEDLVDFIIKEEGFLTKPKDIGDGMLTIGSGLTAQKWHDLYKKRGNKWSQADNRMAVRQEVADRRRWAEKNIPNWNNLTDSAQKALLAYRYNYNYTPQNSPRLFKALRENNPYEAAKQMNATSKNPKFKKGLQARRQREQNWFLSEYDPQRPARVPQIPVYTEPAVSTGFVNPFAIQEQNTFIAPQIVPDEDSYVTAHQLTETEDRMNKAQEEWDAINNFNRLMRLVGIENNPLEQFTSTSPIMQGLSMLGNSNASGGKIHIKPSHRGRLTELKARTGKTEAELYNDGNPAHKKMVVFARNSRKWKHGDGGNLFSGEEEGSQKMQMGLRVTNDWKPFTLGDVMANAARIEQQKRAMEEAVARRVNNYLTTSNDATSVANGRPQNRYLERRAVEGAKSHAAWEKEHPILNAVGNVLGIAPLAVAAIPAVGAAVESAPAITSALAPGSAFWMNPITQQIAASTLGGKAVDLATTTLTPYDSWGEGVSDVVNQTTGWNPNDSWWSSMLADMTNPGYLTPYSLVENNTIKAANAIEDAANNWRPWVPRDANRYYRIVGESGDPIGDAIQSGVVRGPGANPSARASMEATMEAKPIRLATKAHSYPMFSKGKPWEGSTSRVDGKSKPIIIRSKEDTGPVKWEESNVDFSHKGHKGIFRPNYYGELNSTPTRYFEYWEPKRFGYMKREFPVDTNPYHNLMGKGYTVDRGNWMESDLGVEGEKFGEYIGSGGEQTVFQDVSNPSSVLKVYHDTYTKNPEGLQDLVNDYLRRNSIPLQQPASFTGYVKQDGYVYPVFNQGKLLPLGSMSSTEFNTKYLPLLQESLKPYGYTGDGISSEFTNGINTLVDIKPENMGLTPTGELRFLDVDWVTR